MDKITQLQVRKTALLEATSAIREKIAAIVDGESFVELDRYTYSHNDFYDADVIGEGVTTGFATVNDYPVYVAAVNPAVLNGGLSLAGCKKIVKCIDKAMVANAPIVYILSSEGILAGEGVSVLEGVATLIAKMSEASGVIPQFALCDGKVLGSATLLVAHADYVYFTKGSTVAFNSPLVVAAKSGKATTEALVGGENNGNGLVDFVVEDLSEVKNGIVKILETLPSFCGILADALDDPNRDSENLNEKVCAKCLEKAVFDDGSFIELKPYSAAKEVITGIGRVGGYSVAAIIFNGENGVELTKDVIEKIKNFIYYATDNSLPILTFVDALGLKADGETNSSTVLTSVSQLVCALGYANSVPRINVIYGHAVGLGYTLFASKAYGQDYSFAFCNAKIAPVSSRVGAEMEFATKGGDMDALKEKFEDVDMDAMNGAENGYVDNVIEPRYIRQYLVSALQMLIS